MMGSESNVLLDAVERRLQRTRSIVLQLSQIDTIDSSGLGLLVRLQRRVETAGGRMALCMPSPRLAYALQTARMQSLFETFLSEEGAIEALHRPQPSDNTPVGFVYANVLCALESADLVSSVSEVLSQVGYAVLAADNVADAAPLLRVLAEPKLVITTPEFRASGDAEFQRLLGTAVVLDVPPGFAAANMKANVHALISAVRREFGGSATAGPPTLRM